MPRQGRTPIVVTVNDAIASRGAWHNVRQDLRSNGASAVGAALTITPFGKSGASQMFDIHPFDYEAVAFTQRATSVGTGTRIVDVRHDNVRCR